MILHTPDEPIQLRDWMQSLKSTQLSTPGADWDSYVVWAGNKLPKYLWDHWKADLRPLGITWQKFMRILRHRTDVCVLWYQGTLPWADFITKVSDLIESPIGKEGVEPSEPATLGSKDFAAQQIPPPSEWQVMERLSRELWAEIWENPMLLLNGRAGQAQAGVDVYGEIAGQKGFYGGIQCKKKDLLADNLLTVPELRLIVENAKKFRPALKRFIVAYTGKSDVKLQEEARILTRANESKGLFSVQVVSWDDIKMLFGKYPDIPEQYGLVGANASMEYLVEMKAGMDDMLKAQTEGTAAVKNVAQEVQGLQQSVSSIAAFATTMTSGELVGEYGQEIDDIRDQLNSGHAKEALDLLVKLEARMKTNVDNGIRFRVITNKAAALATLGETEKAALLFIEARQYNESDEKAVCNAALGYVLLSRKDEANKITEEVLRKNPMSARGHELRIHGSASSDSFEKILERVPEVLRSNDSIAYALAEAARVRDLRKEATEWLEVALANADPKRFMPDLKSALATSILQNYEKRIDIHAGLQLSEEDEKQIRRAIALLDEAIAPLEHSESLKYRASWVGNRAVGHKLLGEHALALADAEFAIKLEPEHAGFQRQKAFMLTSLGRTDEALVIFKKIAGNPEVPEATLLLAGIYHERGDDRDAIAILEAATKNTAKPSDLLLEEKRLLTHSYMRTDQVEKARALSDELLSMNPGSVTDLVIAAKIQKRNQNQDDYTRILNEARAYVSPETHPRDLLDLAEELYVAKRYGDSYPLYERIVDPRAGSNLCAKLIYSYYGAERYEKALEAARAVPARAKDRFIYDIEVSILQQIQDLKAAIDVSEKYLKEHPEDLSFKVRWATTLLRDSQHEKLDAFLQSDLDISTLREDERLGAAVQLAKLCALRGMSQRALEIAYALRKMHPTDGIAHTAYMAIFLDREKAMDKDMTFDEVSVGTAVAVTEEGSTKKWYVIEERPGQDRDAIQPTHALAKKLLGKRVGDEIVQDQGKPSESRLKVAEIKSKYVYALHDTMERFPHLFSEGDEQPIKRFTVKTDPSSDENAGKQMLDVVDSQLAGRDEHIFRVQKLYTEGQITIGTFANLIGRSPITIWGGVINDARIGLYCCYGNPDERGAAVDAAKSATAVAVDLTALLTCAVTERYQLLKDSFDEIFVAQSTIDELNEEIGTASGMNSKGYMTIWKEDGQYYKREHSEEDIQKQQKFLENVRDWALANCKIATVNEVLKIGKEKREQLFESVGESFLHTMLIAKGKECPIYSDDLGTRGIAFNDFGVKGFWTQTLAIAGFQEGLITQDELEDINIELSRYRYRHTTVSAITLMAAARKTRWTDTGDFAVVLDQISGPNIDLRSSAGVAVAFFHQLWSEPTVPGSCRETLVFAVLDALSKHKDRVLVVQVINALVQVRFQLVPPVGRHVLKVVAAWRTIRT